jgi:hypothetical protein
MSEYVYNYRTNQAAYYISGKYSFGVLDNQAKFYIDGDYWYPFPCPWSSTAAFYRSGKYLYRHPFSSSPELYFGSPS